MKSLSPLLNIGLNTGFQALSRAATAIIALLITRLLAAKLGLSGYGDYQIVIAYASFFWVFTDFGLNILTVREMSSEPEKIQNYFSSLLSLRTSLGLAFMAIATLSLAFLPYKAELKLALTIGTATIFLQALTGTCGAIFQIKGKYFYFFLANLVGSLVLLTILFFLLLSSQSVVVLSLGLVSGYAITSVLSLYFASRWVRLRFSSDRAVLKDLFVKAVPFGLALIFNLTAYSQDFLLLSIVKIPGLQNEKAVGIYSLGYKIFELGIVIPGYFINVIFPLLTREFGVKDFGRLRKHVVFSLFSLVTASFVGLVFLQIAAPSLIGLLTHAEEFNDSISVLRVLAFALPASFLLPLLVHLILIFRRQRWLIAIYGFAWVFNLIANLVFIPRFGYFASAQITVLTEWLLLLALAGSCLYLWSKNVKETN